MVRSGKTNSTNGNDDSKLNAGTLSDKNLAAGEMKFDNVRTDLD